MARPGLLLYFDIIPALERLPHEAVGRLLLAAMHYALDGVEPAFGDLPLEFAWAFLRPSIDRDGAAYDEKRLRGEWMAYCKQCKRDGVEPSSFDTWRERFDNVEQRTDNAAIPTTTTTQLQPNPSTTPTTDRECGADKPPRRARFVPPTLKEVTDYVQKRGSKVDPQGFIDFYAAKGWLVGKTPMKDWKAACRNAEHWERWEKSAEKKRGAKTISPSDIQPSAERIQKSNEWLDKFLEEQGGGQA